MLKSSSGNYPLTIAQEQLWLTGAHTPWTMCVTMDLIVHHFKTGDEDNALQYITVQSHDFNLDNEFGTGYHVPYNEEGWTSVYCWPAKERFNFTTEKQYTLLYKKSFLVMSWYHKTLSLM